MRQLRIRAATVVAGLALALAGVATTVATTAGPAAAAPTCAAQRIDQFQAQGSCSNGEQHIRFRVRVGCHRGLLGVPPDDPLFEYFVTGAWTPTTQTATVSCLVPGGPTGTLFTWWTEVEPRIRPPEPCRPVCP